MSKNLAKIFLLVIIISSFFIAPVHAKKTYKDATNILNEALPSTGYTNTALPQNVPELIGFWIKIALSAVGIIFFVLMFYAGYLWMTARGAEETITTAKNTIIMAVIGLIIVVSGYAISNFIVTYVVERQAGNPATDTENLGTGPLGCCVDWVSSGDKYTDIIKDSWGSGGASKFDSTRACRVTTEADCRLQGESTTAYDKLGCPEGEGCWMFYTDDGYNGTDPASQDMCVNKHC